MTDEPDAGDRGGDAGTPDSARLLLILAAVAVAFAAADTYVVVLALPDMMLTAHLTIGELQRAAPIVSGFLLGYVAMLPLIGRIADLRGRVPVLVFSLVCFSIGSYVTAFSFDLGTMVAGRFLQGVGGGGLVPATLALVADLYPARRRAVPLGVVSAVQEVGSVIGPLFGAAVLAWQPWQVIFLINLGVGAILAGLIAAAARRSATVTLPATTPPHRLLWGAVVAAASLVAAAAYGFMAIRPPEIEQSIRWGQVYIPYAGHSEWFTPMAMNVFGGIAVAVAVCWWARTPFDLRGWCGSLRDADLPGALLLAAVLSGVILAFATADPAVQVFSERGHWYLAGSALAAIALIAHLRWAEAPLIPRGTLRRMPAWGAVIVSLLIGAALIAALVDLPIFARVTVYRQSQILASLVLVRFLVAVPVGAVIGGRLARRWPAGAVTALGMALACGGFVGMSRWDVDALSSPLSTVVLLVCGLGFGLALAPVNAALLASTDAETHGVASALVVVARMIGMLVGVSALTSIGLRSYHRAVAHGATPQQAILAQEHAAFTAAALCSCAAAVAALVFFRGAPTREVDAPAGSLDSASGS